MIDEKLLRKEVTEVITNNIEGLEELFLINGVSDICDKYDMNVMGMVNALIAKTSIQLQLEAIPEDIVTEVAGVVETFSKELKKHPIDSCFILLKVLSDILVQITVAEKITEREREMEHEENDN